MQNPITLELCAQLNEAFSEPVMHLQNKHRETVNQLLIIKNKGDGLPAPIPAHESSNSFNAFGIDSYASWMPRSSVRANPGNPLISSDRSITSRVMGTSASER